LTKRLFDLRHQVRLREGWPTLSARGRARRPSKAKRMSQAKPPAPKEPNGGFLMTPDQHERQGHLLKEVDPAKAARHYKLAEIIRQKEAIEAGHRHEPQRSSVLVRAVAARWSVSRAPPRTP
jgi:hypothetical protein